MLQPQRALFLLLALVIGLGSVAHAQDRRRIRPSQARSESASGEKGVDRPNSKIMTGSPEAEMLARHELAAAEKDYRENLERAREAAQLSTEIRDAYLQNKAFSRVEAKKLERLEKLTRKIRNEAGGSDGEAANESTPVQVEPALARIAEISEKLRNVVEKTPRQVVSASVIERANELLEILRYIRTLAR
jgi:hypothetical protein